MRNKTRGSIGTIAIYGMGIALYVVFSLTVRIPLFQRIKLDMGYVVYGAFLAWFGVPATIIGTIGCILSNLLGGGSFPIGWALAQIFIGVVCGLGFSEAQQKVQRVLLSAGAMAIGMILIKSGIETILFSLDWRVKLFSGSVAFVADWIPFVAGIFLADNAALKRLANKKE